MLKFIVDESTGNKVAQVLINEGFDVVSVIRQMRGSDDLTIIQKAIAEDRILITNDKDFGELVFHQHIKPRGVLFLRLADESPLNKIKILRLVIRDHSDELKNNFVTVSEKKIRKHRIRD